MRKPPHFHAKENKQLTSDDRHAVKPLGADVKIILVTLLLPLPHMVIHILHVSSISPCSGLNSCC